MRVLFLTSGRHVPSTRFRILQYLPGLRRRGHECLVAHSAPAKYRGWPLLGNRLSELPRIAFRGLDWIRALRRRPDVVVLERELLSSGIYVAERLFRRIAPAMVLDVDDAIFIEHPEKFEALASMCDVVIAGNALLCSRIEPLNGNTVVIPTCLDTSRYRSKARAETGRPLVLGWTGTYHNLPSLELIADALGELAQHHDFELRIIAEREPPGVKLKLRGVPVRFVPWREETEIRDLQQIDIGLMPLEDQEWTRYKCGLKILQYMAVGIPAVASPVGVNAQIIRHGENGILVSSRDEWVQQLARLLDDAPLRCRIGSAGRETVQRDFSIDAHVPRFEQALVDATWIARNGRR